MSDAPTPPPARLSARDRRLTRDIVRGAAIVLAMVVGLLLLRFESSVLFIVLSGYLLAISLRYPSRWLARVTRFPYPVALVAVVVVGLAALVLGVWAVGARADEQLQALFEQ